MTDHLEMQMDETKRQELEVRYEAMRSIKTIGRGITDEMWRLSTKDIQALLKHYKRIATTYFPRP